jgi:hypothetical protein
MPWRSPLAFVLKILDDFVGLLEVHEDASLKFFQFEHVSMVDVATCWLNFYSTSLDFIVQVLHLNVAIQGICSVLVRERELVLNLTYNFVLVFYRVGCIE